MKIWIVLLLALTGCASMPKSEWYAAGCAALDLGTTAYALDHGATEVNPLAVDGYEVASLVVFSAVAHWGIHRWVKRTYHNQGKAAPWWLGYGSYRCAIGAWNLDQIIEP